MFPKVVEYHGQRNNITSRWIQEQAKELEQSCTDLAERYEHVVHEFDTLRNDYAGLDGENSQLADQIKVKLPHDFVKFHETSKLDVGKRIKTFFL